jgi:hypothetical protein
MFRLWCRCLVLVRACVRACVRAFVRVLQTTVWLVVTMFRFGLCHDDVCTAVRAESHPSPTPLVTTLLSHLYRFAWGRWGCGVARVSSVWLAVCTPCGCLP